MRQNSPIIFWLLLLATICVDVVAFNWVVTVNSSSASTVLQALVSGEVSVLCIWSGLSRQKSAWTRLVPWLAVVAAEASRLAVNLWINNFHIPSGSSLWHVSWLSQRILHVALLLCGLWLFERTPFWQRRTAAAANWRFSLGQLLMITTIVAVFTACIHYDQSFVTGRLWDELPFVVAMTVLGLASAISWSLLWHWLLRLALVLAVAIALGAALVYYCQVSARSNIPYYIIQAILLSSWLGLGSVLPSSTTSAAAAES